NVVLPHRLGVAPGCVALVPAHCFGRSWSSSDSRSMATGDLPPTPDVSVRGAFQLRYRAARSGHRRSLGLPRALCLATLPCRTPDDPSPDKSLGLSMSHADTG